MTCKELIECLTRFDPEELIDFVAAGIENRRYYKTMGCQLIDETAAILLEVAEAGPLDEILEEG